MHGQQNIKKKDQVCCEISVFTNNNSPLRHLPYRSCIQVLPPL